MYLDIVQILNNTKETEEKKKFPTPVLDAYTQDLSIKAKEGKIDKLIGRKEELQRLIQILGRRTKKESIRTCKNDTKER